MSGLHSKTFCKIFSMLTIVFLLPTMILSLFSISKLYMGEKENHIAATAEKMDKYQYNIEETLQTLRNLCDNYTQMDWVKKQMTNSAIASTKLESLERIKLYEEMVRITQNNLVEQVAIIFPYKNLVVSSLGVCPIDQFAAILFHDDIESWDRFYMYTTKSNKLYLANVAFEINKYGLPHTVTKVYALYHTLDVSANNSATLVLMLDNKAMEKWMERFLDDVTLGIRIETLTEPTLTIERISSPDISKDELNAYMFMSACLPWRITMYTKHDTGRLLSSIFQYIILLLLLLFLCICISLFMARRSVKPLGQLISRAGISPNIRAKRLDEYTILAEHLDMVDSERDALKLALNNYENQMKRLTIRLLFIGDEQFNPECLHMLNIDFRNDDLFCVIFTLNKLHNTDLDHIRESTGVYTYISLNDIYGCCALILCQRDKNASALRAFADMLSRNLDVFSGGVYEGISGIASSAKEAVHLLEEHAICIDDVKGEDSRSKNSMLADCITAYIDQNIADANLSLTQVAQAFDISESQVSKIFRYEHNINFAKYIAMRRIELAKIYMREKHLSVTEVGQLVGYPSDHTFRRVFKKLENMTPSAYMEIVFKNSMLKEDKTC